MSRSSRSSRLTSRVPKVAASIGLLKVTSIVARGGSVPVNSGVVPLTASGATSVVVKSHAAGR